MARFCLNMIVKNEAARIERALASCVEFIDAAVIVDTGSTDNTIEVIQKFFETHQLPCVIKREQFLDWSQARNEALLAGRQHAPSYGCEYLLLMDADMELVVKDAVSFLAQRHGASYDMYQHGGAVHYQNRRLVHANTDGIYLGVTHEYLDVGTCGCIAEDVAYFVDHADGANRPDKFKRDIRLLRAGLKQEPNNARYFFYLAQSYRDAGLPEKAVHWYKRRVEAGGWDEEVWNAQLNMAHAYKDMGNEAEFIRNLLVAYNLRPSRAESLYDLAHYYRDKGMNAVGTLIASAGVNAPLSKDALFVNDFVYKSGLKEEFSIMAFYQPETRDEGFKVANKLALARTPYGAACDLARDNLYHYIKPLTEYCPSFTWKNIEFTPPDGWTAMNPCVTRLGDTAAILVRTVNYRIENGRYLIKDVADDGVCGTNANDSNPINTRNYMLHVGFDPMSQTRPEVSEVLPPGNMPCEFKPVIGFEDMRIFEHLNRLYASSTVRQIHWDGNCEQVLTRLDPCTGGYVHTDVQRMLREPRETQKNWAPICEPNGTIKFMWRPGEVVDQHGATVVKHDTGLATGHISGGSQLIPFSSDGWLALVHEARAMPGTHLRYYSHRFAYYDADFRLLKLSLPFVFHDKVIEFAAGLCRHPSNRNLVISYGYKDNEARIATVSPEEVSTLLWFHSKS